MNEIDAHYAQFKRWVSHQGIAPSVMEVVRWSIDRALTSKDRSAIAVLYERNPQDHDALMDVAIQRLRD